MIEADIQDLGAGEAARDLRTLEADVWAGIDARVQMARTAKTMMACQTGVVALILVTAAATGNLTVRSAPTARLDVFSSAVGLAPSTLLLGHKT
ncbi:MAG: hypothetical protein EPO08_17255 [Rhodospirillaceae bacterium]|nr:MAG: hypothetical protein EPO08_17255 [Rhodospirillaceae bacterium]